MSNVSDKEKFLEVENQILSHIVPHIPILPVVKSTIGLLEKSAKKLKIDCRIVCGGSVAKNTYLSDDFDCDVFVRFDPKKHSDLEISNLVKQILDEQKISYQILHGSRDYYKATIEGITYEFVPTLDVDKPSDAKNVTDLSVFHVDWVLGECKKNHHLQNQIRLMKAFCKACGTYGAESYIGGFSGHVVDILVIFAGGFDELLVLSQKWPDHYVIDICKYYSGKNKNALLELNEAKLTSPIIIVDPIIPDRNAASALTKKTFEKFKQTAIAYLSNPDVSFFVKKDFNASDLDKKSGITYCIHVEPKSDKKDVAGAQIVKVMLYLLEQFRKHDFIVVGSGWNWSGNCCGEIFIRVSGDVLTELHIVKGPPAKITAAVTAFSKIHSGAFLKDGFYWAQVLRKNNTLIGLLNDLEKQELITSRCNKFTFKKL